MALLTPSVVGPTLLIILALAPLCTALLIGSGYYGYGLCWSAGFFLPYVYAYPMIYDPAVHGESAQPGGTKHVCAAAIARPRQWPRRAGAWHRPNKVTDQSWGRPHL